MTCLYNAPSLEVLLSGTLPVLRILYSILNEQSNHFHLSLEGYMKKRSILSIAMMTVALQSAGIIQKFEAPGERVTGLTFDGEHLWASCHKPDSLYKLNPETGEVLGAYANSKEVAAGRDIVGVGCAGGSIYVGFDDDPAVRAGIYRHTLDGEYQHNAPFRT